MRIAVISNSAQSLLSCRGLLLAKVVRRSHQVDTSENPRL